MVIKLNFHYIKYLLRLLHKVVYIKPVSTLMTLRTIMNKDTIVYYYANSSSFEIKLVSVEVIETVKHVY